MSYISTSDKIKNYGFEKIKNDRFRLNLVEFKVKYFNLTSKHNSWVKDPEIKCQDLVQGYFWEKNMKRVIIHKYFIF